MPLLLFAAVLICRADDAEESVWYDKFKVNNRIDTIVIEKLKDKRIPPSVICSDEVFIRRVYLDAAGTLPTPGEVKNFLHNSALDKRAKLIDHILASDDFADYQGLLWGDILKIKAEFPSNLWPQAAHAYDRWVRKCIRDNMPYDQFVCQLLTSSGSNFHIPPVNYYRTFQGRNPRDIAVSTAQLFMGVNLTGGEYSENQIMEMAAFFAKIGYKNTDEWKEEIVYFNEQGKLSCPVSGKVIKPVPLDGIGINIPADKDPRQEFARWLTSPNNPWFAKNAVNRVWYRLTGRRIVAENENINSPQSSPWSAELLNCLEQELISHKFDIKHIYRLILNSTTYQLSSRTNRYNLQDNSGFSRYIIRRLDAEVLIDAVCQITGTGEIYSSNIPEPYTFLPNGKRAITVADGSIESPFFELFGRPPRNTSFESERNNKPTVLQAQYLLNSSNIQRKIESSGVLRKLYQTHKNGASIINELYLLILSRPPMPNELDTAMEYATGTGRKHGEPFNDIAWALINTKEFYLKH
jgi:hypothetical protein